MAAAFLWAATCWSWAMDFIWDSSSTLAWASRTWFWYFLMVPWVSRAPALACSRASSRSPTSDSSFFFMRMASALPVDSVSRAACMASRDLDWFFLMAMNSSSFSARRRSISCLTWVSSSWERSTLFSSCSRVASASSSSACSLDLDLSTWCSLACRFWMVPSASVSLAKLHLGHLELLSLGNGLGLVLGAPHGGIALGLGHLAEDVVPGGGLLIQSLLGAINLVLKVAELAQEDGPLAGLVVGQRLDLGQLAGQRALDLHEHVEVGVEVTDHAQEVGVLGRQLPLAGLKVA